MINGEKALRRKRESREQDVFSVDLITLNASRLTYQEVIVRMEDTSMHDNTYWRFRKKKVFKDKVPTLKRAYFRDEARELWLSLLDEGYEVEEVE